ncbi:MAG: porin family protein [Chryseolinea sp.]
MKKLFYTLALSLLVIAAHAQKDIRLNGYGAYVFDDKFDTYYSSNVYVNGKIKGGFMWGAGLELGIRDDYGAELSYYRLDTKAPIYLAGVRDRTIDLGINYIMLGGMRYLMVANEKVEPYGGLLLGMAIFNNKNPQGSEASSATKFAWGARLGTNIWLSDRVGLKLQAYVLSAVQGAGGGLYFGTGGAGAGVSTYSTLYQFGLGGGLAIKLGGGGE